MSYNQYPHDRRASSHSRAESPSFSTGKALASVVGGAAAATVLDKYLLQRRRRSSHDEPRSKDPWRRLADVAVGGFAGLEAYNHFHKSQERGRERSYSHSHAVRDVDEDGYDEDERYDREERALTHRSRSHSHNRNHHGQHLLEAAVGARGLQKEWQAHQRGYDDHPWRHAAETGIGLYGVGSELAHRRPSR